MSRALLSASVRGSPCRLRSGRISGVALMPCTVTESAIVTSVAPITASIHAAEPAWCLSA